jgi:hypothetical protein
MAGDEDFFSDAGVIGNDYSLDDADLSGALTARLQQVLSLLALGTTVATTMGLIPLRLVYCY